jgi:anaerobic selenocysteine-containing dehydrogenase
MSEGLYDEEFVEKWTNGPVLVRTDNMELLREGEVVPGGDLRDFLLFPESIEDRSNRPTLMVWDTLTDSPQVADTPGVKPALFGQYDLTLVDGTEVECKPVFQILSDEAAQYPPERAAEICWTGSAEKIRESARIFATSPSASLGRSALGMNTNWFQEARLKRILAAITGNLNREGGLSGKPSHRWILGEWKRGGLGAGGVFSEGGARGHKCFGALDDHQRSSMEGPYPFEPALGEYPLQIGFTSQIDGFRSMSTGKPYRIAGLSIAQTNPLSWCEDLKSVYEGLMALEFLAVDDLWLTPTAHLADIVLPAGLGPFNRGEKKVIEPLFERWADEKYFVELGKRVNPDWWFMEDEEGYWAWRHAIEKELAAEAEAAGIPVERGAPAPSLKFYEEIDPQTGKPIGFPTPTGKVEIYSVITKQLGSQHGIDPIPVYVEPMQSPYSTPDLHKKYPLVLTTGTRLPVYYHSEHRANPLQRELYPYPEVDINQETAAELGIKHGDWVWIETKTGKIRMKARLTIGIDPRVVSTKHGWWQGCKELGLAGYGWDGANANILISGDEHDPALGMPGMRAALCKIYRAEEPPFVWDPPYYGSGVPEEYLGPAEYPEQSRQED